MSARGGSQHIPRPRGARPGDPPPWARLAPERRRLTLTEARERCADLPVPEAPPLVVPGSRAAAVLVPLFEEHGEARVILTKRPDEMPSHRGEIAFPGGKVHPEIDLSLRDAALRETEEEIGLRRADVDVIAELDTIATIASRFTITPFVGLLDGRPVLVPAPHEVVKILDVPLSDLLDPVAYREERWDIGPPDRRVVFFELPGETVWGATARILARFLSHLTATSP